MHPDYAFSILRNIPITADQTNILNDIVLKSGGSIEGTAWDEQGQPIANEHIYVRSPEHDVLIEPSRRWGTAVTDANGHYRIDHLPSQPCIVYRDHTWKSLGVRTRIVTPIEGETTNLDFGGNYKVTGQLDSNHISQTNTRMRLFTWDKSHFESVTRSEPGGDFCFVGVIPGTYTIEYEDVSDRKGFLHLTTVTVTDQNQDLGLIAPQKKAPFFTDLHKLKKPVDSQPRLRYLDFRLPLPPDKIQWTFLSKATLFAGKLQISILHTNQQADTITIFENGTLSEGWTSPPLAKAGAGEIAFTFHSTQQYLTSPDDKISIELTTPHDLEGIGPIQTGILPAGAYHAESTFTTITDELPLSEVFKTLPPEALAKVKKMTEHRAKINSWESHWLIEITSDQGWLPEGKPRDNYLKAMKQIQTMLEK